MNHSSTPTNGLGALEESRTYVTKVGGENAGKLRMNAASAIDRHKRGKRQIIAFSAIRSVDARYSPLSDPLVIGIEGGKMKPGFNTTSHLIAIAQLLRKADRSSIVQAEGIAQKIGVFLRQLLEAEINADAEIQNREMLLSELNDCIDSFIDGDDQPRSLLNKIRRMRDPQAVFQSGVDWIMHSDDEYVSITGIGERLSQELYAKYFTAKTLPITELQIEHTYQSIYRNIDQKNTASAEINYMKNLLQRRISAILSTGAIGVAGGYLPVLGTERGYSDKTGALLAEAASVEYPDTVYIVEKEFPLMSADPKRIPEARTVQRMTHFLARELFGGSRGAGAGALHPAALDMLARKKISIVVMNPEQAPTPANTTLVQDFVTEPNGVEIITSKKIPFALQISDSALVDNPEFEADMIQWFHRHHTPIQHIATSEGTASFTFHEGSYSEELQRDLRAHLQNTYGITGADCVKHQDQVALIYCLGNNMNRPGQAAKAATALDFAGVDIHFINQGLNEAVMTFLVSSKDADRAIQMLHDIFITLDEHTFDQLRAQFKQACRDAIDSASRNF